jgi:RNA polymerase-interacting CarD/CdnL/TRCF family regulator
VTFEAGGFKSGERVTYPHEGATATGIVVSARTIPKSGRVYLIVTTPSGGRAKVPANRTKKGA